MTEKDLQKLAEQFRALVQKLEVHDFYKRFHTTQQHDGSPHIEARDDGFHFVVTERGVELERKEALTADEVLYELLVGVTLEIATNHELNNRDEDIDGRRVWFPLQEQLMSNLNPRWGQRLQEEHEKILEKNPIRD